MATITFSTKFPSYHPKKNLPTNFVEKIQEGLILLGNYEITDEQLSIGKSVFKEYVTPVKYHTIRAGNRWKAGMKFSPRVWGNDINPKSSRSGPYHSKQIIIAPDIEIKKVWDFEIKLTDVSRNEISVNGQWLSENKLNLLAQNDGLTIKDFYDWFKMGGDEPDQKEIYFSGQVISWNENISY